MAECVIRREICVKNDRSAGQKTNKEHEQVAIKPHKHHIVVFAIEEQLEEQAQVAYNIRLTAIGNLNYLSVLTERLQNYLIAHIFWLTPTYKQHSHMASCSRIIG
jgi:hypothetical protein